MEALVISDSHPKNDFWKSHAPSIIYSVNVKTRDQLETLKLERLKRLRICQSEKHNALQLLSSFAIGPEVHLKELEIESLEISRLERFDFPYLEWLSIDSITVVNCPEKPLPGIEEPLIFFSTPALRNVCLGK